MENFKLIIKKVILRIKNYLKKQKTYETNIRRKEFLNHNKA